VALHPQVPGRESASWARQDGYDAVLSRRGGWDVEGGTKAEVLAEKGERCCAVSVMTRGMTPSARRWSGGGAGEAGGETGWKPDDR